VWIGDRGFELAFADAELARRVRYSDFRMIPRRDQHETFRYGELVALSGDFYGSPGDLYWEKRSSIPWLWESNDLSDIRAVFAEEINAIKEQQLQGLRYPDNNLAFWWNAKAYVELALDNTHHFGWHNLKAYCKYHEEALTFARQARDVYDLDRAKAGELWGQALFSNAFADHFLTDAFAAGHVRVPRQEIIRWSIDQKHSKELAGALSKLLHDQDGHLKTLHGAGHSLNRDDAEGLLVRNSTGTIWRTRCDGQLFIKNGDDVPAVRQPVEAVAASVRELFKAYLYGQTPEEHYAATRFIPFPHSDEPTLMQKFPADISAGRIEALLEQVKWYMKIPYTNGGLGAEHIKTLCVALPGLMGQFRLAVQQDVARRNSPLVRRLSPELIAGYASIQ
jgi:hypothetical protein